MGFVLGQVSSLLGYETNLWTFVLMIHKNVVSWEEFY